MSFKGIELSKLEEALLFDLLERRKPPRHFSWLVGALGVVSLLLLEPSGALLILTAGLCGGLVGAFLERKHLADLARVVGKLVTAFGSPDGTWRRSGRLKDD